MKRPAIFKAIRIGVAIFCLLACVTALALWQRSLTAQESVYSPNGRLWFTSSQQVLQCRFKATADEGAFHYWRGGYAVVKGSEYPWWTTHGFSYRFYPQTVFIAVPHWVFALATGGTGIVLLGWFRRFTLRMLLVATTIFAVVLGLMVYKK